MTQNHRRTSFGLSVRFIDCSKRAQLASQQEARSAIRSSTATSATGDQSPDFAGKLRAGGRFPGEFAPLDSGADLKRSVFKGGRGRTPKRGASFLGCRPALLFE